MKWCVPCPCNYICLLSISDCVIQTKILFIDTRCFTITNVCKQKQILYKTTSKVYTNFIIMLLQLTTTYIWFFTFNTMSDLINQKENWR